MHHTKEKGDLAVLKAQVDLFEKGYIVATPLTEHAPFDLIVYKEGVCKTIQVKYRSIDKFGKLNIKFANTYSDSRGVHIKQIDKNLIDVYCIYCPQTEKCYYFDPKKFKKHACFRVTSSKNNQQKNVNYLVNYTEMI